MRIIDVDRFLDEVKRLYLSKGWSDRDVHFSLRDLKANMEADSRRIHVIPTNWIKKWCKEHWPQANDGSDMIVDNMMEDWWKESVETREYADPWVQHLAFCEWMKTDEYDIEEM